MRANPAAQSIVSEKEHWVLGTYYTHLSGSLDNKKNFLVRSSLLREIVALEHHTALRDVHEPQKVYGTELDRLENLLVNPRL